MGGSLLAGSALASAALASATLASATLASATLASATLASATLAGCSRPAASAASAAGGWRELRSEHFTVRTNLDEDDAGEVTRELEILFATLRDVAFGGRGAVGRTNVVVFRTRGEYEELAPKSSSAYFMHRLPNDLEAEPTIVLYGGLSQAQRIVIGHELAHRFLHAGGGRLPVWLDEGLAEVYSTIRADGGRAYLGEQDPSRTFVLGNEWRFEEHGAYTEVSIPVQALLPPRQLMALPEERFYAARNASDLDVDAARAHFASYASAWALAHMLMFGPPEYQQRFGRAMEAVAKGQPGAAALAQALADIPADKLEKDFYGWVSGRRQHVEAGYAAKAPSAPEARPMTAADVYLTRARLGHFAGEAPSAIARGYFDRALAAAPKDPEVDYWTGVRAFHDKQYAAAAEAFERAIRAKPGEPRYLLGAAWLYSVRDGAGALPEDERQTRLVSTMEALVPSARSPMQHDAAAEYLAQTGRTREALAHANAACHLDPDCGPCLATLASVHFALGDAAKAVEAQTMAIGRVAEWAPPGVLRSYVGTLERYKKARAEASR